MADSFIERYFNAGRTSSRDATADALSRIEARLGITPGSKSLGALPGGPSPSADSQDGGGSGFKGTVKKLRRLGLSTTREIQKSEEAAGASAEEYANYLRGQVSRGEKSSGEAADLFSNFAIAHNIPGGFKTAEQLASLPGGTAPESSTERFSPFIGLAAQNLGINVSPKQAKSITSSARALGKTTPEAFAQFLGSALTSSPEYIRKNPLAFSANLPASGYYGLGYQTPEGTFTGTYRFKPPSTVNYS